MKPMKEILSVFYSVNEFEGQTNQVTLLDSLLDVDFEDFREIFDLLDSAEIEPNKKLVKKLIDFSKTEG